MSGPLRLKFRSASPVAQLVERLAVNQFVAGSSPARGANLPVEYRLKTDIYWRQAQWIH